MRSFRPSRRSRNKGEDERDPLAALRRRCAGGAVAAGSAYLAVFTTAAVRPTAMHEPVAVGLLVGFGTVAGLCALGAVLAWSVGRLERVCAEQQAEELKWAVRLGEDMADAFRGASAATPGGR